jgi:hypothetical protein
MPRHPWIPAACTLILCLIPLNIYVIGDYLAEGIQCAFFRYQASPIGSSFITSDRDIYFVTNSILTGSSMVSAVIWIAGAVLLLLALLVYIATLAGCAMSCTDDSRLSSLTRTGGVLVMGAGILFLSSVIVQYGIMLHNLHGYSVPLGVPVILVAGALLIHGDPAGYREKTGSGSTGPGTGE